LSRQHDAELSARRQQQQSHVRSLHGISADTDTDADAANADAGGSGDATREQLSRMVAFLLR